MSIWSMMNDGCFGYNKICHRHRLLRLLLLSALGASPHGRHTYRISNHDEILNSNQQAGAHSVRSASLLG